VKRNPPLVRPCFTFVALFLLLLVTCQTRAQVVLTQDKNPDFRSQCEKEPQVKALQDKVLYGYPEMEPCYQVALIECQLRGTGDGKMRADLEAKKAVYLAEANDKRLNCPNQTKAKDPKLNILISRQHEGGSYTDKETGQTESCITGYVSVNGTVVAYTLELPYRNNKSDISSIPAGQYDATIHFEGRSGPYENEGYRITLLNVPYRSGIQIHIGNYPTQIEGCILVGTKVDPAKCTLEGSAAAYQKLKKAVQEQAELDASAEEKKITVTIQNTGRQN